MLVKDVYKIERDAFVDPMKEDRERFIMEFLKPTDRKRVLYIHTPYCPSRCKYCKWETSQGFRTQATDHWLQTIPQQIEQYRDIFENVIFDEVYFGGGTPTYVGHGTMEYLFTRIPNFQRIPNKCIEASPSTLTTDHIDLFTKYCFDFISVGIQTLNPLIAKKQNRPFISRREVKTIVQYILETGMYLNLDMICYLNHGDLRDLPDFKKDLFFLCTNAKPTSITIHQEYNAHQSKEKTKALMLAVRDFCYDEYRCVNSRLKNTEVYVDTMYRAEYKIARDRFDYMHHLWDKYNVNLKNDYQVLSLGSTAEHPLASFVLDKIFLEENNLIVHASGDEYPFWMYDYLKEYRKEMGWS